MSNVLLADPNGPIVGGRVVSLQETLSPFARWILGLGHWLRVLYVVQLFTLLGIFIDKSSVLYLLLIPLGGLLSLVTLKSFLLFAVAFSECMFGLAGLACVAFQLNDKHPSSCTWFFDMSSSKNDKFMAAASFGVVALASLLACLIGFHFARLVTKFLSSTEFALFRTLL